MAGQNHHFKQYAREKLNYAIGRYVNEINRLHAVFNKHLADRAFVAGEYSIAGMAAYPWIVPHESQGRKLADFPHLEQAAVALLDDLSWWGRTLQAGRQAATAQASGD